MKKQKLVLTKETVKNLTLNNEELGSVVGGAGGGGVSVATTGANVTFTTISTGATCHSCGKSCLACPGLTTGTSVINPPPFLP